MFEEGLKRDDANATRRVERTRQGGLTGEGSWQEIKPGRPRAARVPVYGLACCFCRGLFCSRGPKRVDKQGAQRVGDKGV
eukprot:2744537-Rhodomonas_salina.4